MIKKIQDILKRLFDYQKFEKNPKLEQTIKDSLKEDPSLISSLDLSKVAGGNYGETGVGVSQTVKCPNCGNTFTYQKVVGPVPCTYRCPNCNYTGTAE